MSEKIQLDDLVSRIDMPTGVDQTIAVIADTDPYELNKAILDSLDKYNKSSGMGTVDDDLYGVQFAARIHQERKKLAKPMKQAAAILGAVAMGGSMFIGIQEMRNVQELARSNAPQEIAMNEAGISDDTIDRASIFFGTLGIFSGLLAGRMFGSMVEQTEAQRRARKIIEKVKES